MKIKKVEELNENSTEKCRHTFAQGYTMEPIIYCTKCDKELDEIFKEDLSTIDIYSYVYQLADLIKNNK